MDRHVRSRGGARAGSLRESGGPTGVGEGALGALEGCEWKRDAGWVGVVQFGRLLRGERALGAREAAAEDSKQ